MSLGLRQSFLKYNSARSQKSESKNQTYYF